MEYYSNEKEEQLDLVQQRLNGNYSDIMRQMGMVSNMIKANPESKELKNLLYSLSETATKIISTQICFAHAYSPDEKYKDEIIGHLMKKRQGLLSEIATELNATSSNTKSR